MRLRRLKIVNFRAVRQQELSFEDGLGQTRDLTVLAGPNGCGKTSILYAVYRALSGAMGYHSADVPEPSDAEVFREGGSAGWSFQPNRVTVRLDLVYGADEMAAISKVLEATRPLQKPRADGRMLAVPPLPQGRLTATWNYPPEQAANGTYKSTSYLRTNPGGGATWLSAPKYAIRGWINRPRRLVDLELIEKVGILRMFAQNRGKRWVAADEQEVLASEAPDSNEPSEQDRRRPRSEVTVSKILKLLADAAHGRRINAVPDQETLEERLREAFARVCSPKKYVGYVYFGEDPIGTPLLEENGRQYPLSMAATGEQVILDYLTQFVYPRPVNNSIVLIDEPELHLHPRWIRQLYRALPLLGRGNQFVMTTHSPELRQLAAEGNSLIDLGNLGEPTGVGASA